MLAVFGIGVFELLILGGIAMLMIIASIAVVVTILAGQQRRR